MDAVNTYTSFAAWKNEQQLLRYLDHGTDGDKDTKGFEKST